MPLDLTKLSVGEATPAVVHPRDIFTALPTKAAKYQYPRDVQTQIWNAWYAARSRRDNVIKMNTGAGKTVVGLLILRSCLAERIGPAVYVAPDNYLVRQVISEAAALGIECTDDAYSGRFLAGQSVLVANVHKLINGRSVFSQRNQGTRVPIGSIVVDDVHACLGTAEAQFTITLTSDAPLYGRLLTLFRDDLTHQSSTTILDVEAHEPGKVMLVPYWAWSAKQPQVTALLHAERDSDALKFSWPLLKDVLSQCQCTFGGGKVEITSRCLPIDVILSFAEAKRRIFMSATLADDSILVTHFDVAPEAAAAPLVPATSSDVGDRLILVPQEMNPTLEDEELKALVAEVASTVNVVVLVPSGYRAAFWEEKAALTLTADTMSDGVARLKAGHVGLVVVVNKYDGVDLPDDACRLLVLDGIPDVRRGIDRLEESVLYGSPEQLARVMQRIEQGMGRGVRSSEDRCAVLLMGRSLTRYLYVEGALSKLTPATKAQFELSQRIAQQVRGGGIADLRDAVNLVLQRDATWIQLSRNTLLQVHYEAAGLVSDIARRQRLAFHATVLRDYRQAARYLQEAVNGAPAPRVRGWLKQQLAEVVHQYDVVESQQILKSAQSDNRLVLRPVDGISYIRLPGGTTNQANAVSEFVRERYENRNQLLVDVYAQLEILTFYPGTAEAFEGAVAWLAYPLGYTSQRPEKEYGHGPDVLWSLGALRYFVIECKNGVTNGIINKSDANQIAGSANWFRTQYDASCKAIPLLIHPVATLHDAAAPADGLRILEVEGLHRLKAAVRQFAMFLTSGDVWPTPVTIARSLQQHLLTSDAFMATYTVAPKRRP